jgi:hypothetical protein
MECLLAAKKVIQLHVEKADEKLLANMDIGWGKYYLGRLQEAKELIESNTKQNNGQDNQERLLFKDIPISEEDMPEYRSSMKAIESYDDAKPYFQKVSVK